MDSVNMYYVNTHCLLGKNNLQKDIVKKVEAWKGTLLLSAEARNLFIMRMGDEVASSNAAFPKCKPCRLNVYPHSIGVDYEGVVDSGFVAVEFMKVTAVSDGQKRGSFSEFFKPNRQREGIEDCLCHV